MIDIIIQICIAIFGVTAVFCSQTERYKKYASIFGLVGQPFWFWAAYSHQQWGIFALCFLYTFAWMQGFWRYWLSDFVWRLKRLHLRSVVIKFAPIFCRFNNHQFGDMVTRPGYCQCIDCGEEEKQENIRGYRTIVRRSKS